MDHADGDSFLLGREAGEIGFGADGAEGLPVDGGSVGFVAMGHQGLPKRARTCRAVRPVFSGGDPARALRDRSKRPRSEEHTSELQSLMRLSYAVFCLKKKKRRT